MCSFKPQAARAVPPCGCVSTPGHGAVCEVGVQGHPQGKPRRAAWQRGLSTALPVPLVLHSPTKRLAPWRCRTRSYRATCWWSAPQRKRARDLMVSMARHWAQPGVWLLYLLVVVLQFLGIFKLVSSLVVLYARVEGLCHCAQAKFGFFYLQSSFKNTR